jgi:hypothetical protein
MCRTESQKWNDKIDFAWSDFKNFIKDMPEKSSVFYLENPFMVAGSDIINELLKLNHFQNIMRIKDVIRNRTQKNTFRG